MDFELFLRIFPTDFLLFYISRLRSMSWSWIGNGSRRNFAPCPAFRIFAAGLPVSISLADQPIVSIFHATRGAPCDLICNRAKSGASRWAVFIGFTETFVSLAFVMGFWRDKNEVMQKTLTFPLMSTSGSTSGSLERKWRSNPRWETCFVFFLVHQHVFVDKYPWFLYLSASEHIFFACM